MKAGLLLATLSLVALAQAKKYELSCSKSELSIRWPSYESNSEYYICPRLYGKQLVVECEPGQVFTFVLQSCTSPSKYIPAPTLDALPTASPLPSKPNKDGYLTPMEIPHAVPPRLSALNPAIVDMPAQPKPPVMTGEIPKMPNTVAETPKIEENKPVQNVTLVVVAVNEPAKPLAPLPPTPAPTPPVVADDKKNSADKKKSSGKPSKTAKKTNKNEKKTKNDKKTKNGKKTTKTDKTPKKSAKKTAKKTSKA